MRKLFVCFLPLGIFLASCNEIVFSDGVKGGGLKYLPGHEGDPESFNNPSPDLPPLPPSVIVTPPANEERAPRNRNMNANQIDRNLLATNILRQKCLSCHDGVNGFPSQFEWDNDQAWKDEGLVNPANVQQSILLLRLKNPPNGPLILGGSVRDMPQPGNQPALSVAEINTLIDWIELMDRPNAVLFQIAAGTGNASWNTSADPIELKVGDVLRVRNNDSVGHRIHANNNRPFPHGPQINPNNFFDHVVINPANSLPGGSDQIYEHNVGTSARIFLRATPR